MHYVQFKNSTYFCRIANFFSEHLFQGQSTHDFYIMTERNYNGTAHEISNYAVNDRTIEDFKKQR